MTPDYFHLRPPSDQSEDRYGERLRLTVEPVPAILPRDSLFTIRARLTIDGAGVPIVPFPRGDDGDYDFSDEKIPFGAAIAAAVVVRDVPGDVDQLHAIAMNHQGSGRFSGEDAEVTAEERSLAVRVVVKRRTPRAEQGAGGRYANSVRTATLRFRVGEVTDQNAPDDVWLIEHIQSVGADHYRGRVRRLNIDDDSSIVAGEFVLPSIDRLPARFPIARNGLTTADTDRALYVLDYDASSGARSIVYIEQDGELDPNPAPGTTRVEAIGASGSMFVWVATENELLNVTGAGADPNRRIEGVQCRALAVGRTLDAWAAVRTIENPAVRLARYDFNASGEDDLIITRVSELVDYASRWMLLESMADDGVLCYARYETRRTLVRFSAEGELMAVGSEPIDEVIEMGRNPYSGEAVVVRLDPTRQTVISLFDPALELVREYRPTDDLFENEFVQFFSADVSARREGSRIWITGWRRERDQFGNLVERGAVGYLDAAGSYHHVLGGLPVNTFVRAMF